MPTEPEKPKSAPIKKAVKKAVKKTATKKAVPVEPATLSPFEELEKRFTEIEKRFENLFPEKWFHLPRWEMPEWPAMPKLELKTPHVDIIDRDKDIIVRADVPGVKKKNLDVSVTDNTITIKGTTSEEKKEEDGDYFRSETIKGSFTRTMSLPSDVDGSKAKSSFKNGVLEVVIPKQSKSHRKKVKIG
jgi:HSP20 family protein